MDFCTLSVLNSSKCLDLCSVFVAYFTTFFLNMTLKELIIFSGLDLRWNSRSVFKRVLIWTFDPISETNIIQGDFEISVNTFMVDRDEKINIFCQIHGIVFVLVSRKLKSYSTFADNFHSAGLEIYFHCSQHRWSLLFWWLPFNSSGVSIT